MDARGRRGGTSRRGSGARRFVMPVTERGVPPWAPYRPVRDGRPRLLYVSPVMPSMTGSGLAMRAGVVLCTLAETYRVSLLVDPRYAGDAWPDLAFRRICERIAVVQAGGPTGALFLDDRFDVIHVFRLAALPAIRPGLRLLGAGPGPAGRPGPGPRSRPAEPAGSAHRAALRGQPRGDVRAGPAHESATAAPAEARP